MFNFKSYVHHLNILIYSKNVNKNRGGVSQTQLPWVIVKRKNQWKVSACLQFNQAEECCKNRCCLTQAIIIFHLDGC